MLFLIIIDIFEPKIFIMGNYIKYKRFEKETDEIELQKYFDELIAEGWEIIYYYEKKGYPPIISVVIVAGKTHSQIKNIL